MFEISALKEKKISELQEIASELGIKKITTLKKMELAYKIIDHYAANPKISEEKKSDTVETDSKEIKTALKKGLKSTGCSIEDIGLSLSPMVYFAQFNLNADAVAMVTASHNENGWTGVKMGIKKGLTHAPEEMKELKDITLNENFINGKGDEK